MKADFVNPFVTAAAKVLHMILGGAPVRGELSARVGVFTSHQCNVVFGVTGSLEGQMIFGMSLHTADKIASVMLGYPIKTFDELAASAIAEMGNIISGAALTELSRRSYQCVLSPPTLLRGAKVKISTLEIPSLVIPLITECGEIEINVSLQQFSK